jgi:hypothetical protein
MHNREEYQINFQPEESKDPEIREIFKSRTAQILWCSIKQNNITHQYFNATVLEIAKRLDEYRPEPGGYLDYPEFIAITRKLNTQFGVVTVEEFMLGCSQVVDNEFWADIYKAFKQKRCFKIKYVC